MANYKTSDIERYTVKAQSDKALYTLKGILQGIAIESAVNVLEIDELTNWLSLHRHEQPFSPFKEIFPIIDSALADGILEPEELQDIIWACDQFDNGKYFEYATLSLQYLHGVFHGVLADNKLTDIEIKNLSSWLDDNQEFLAGTYPFDEVCSLISSILQDGIITEDERKTLFTFMGEFIDCSESYNISQVELDDLREKYSVSGICAMQPDVILEDKIFCFTGDSCRASRSEIEEIIKKAGGKFRGSVSSKTDYLVVGSSGSSSWAFSCYGRKVEKAIELRKAGGKIQIVHESDFWDAIASEQSSLLSMLKSAQPASTKKEPNAEFTGAEKEVFNFVQSIINQHENTDVYARKISDGSISVDYFYSFFRFKIGKAKSSYILLEEEEAKKLKLPYTSAGTKEKRGFVRYPFSNISDLEILSKYIYASFRKHKKSADEYLEKHPKIRSEYFA